MLVACFGLLFTLIVPALSGSPTNGYAPGNLQCPSEPLLRAADSISTEEAEWLAQSDSVTKSELANWLSRAKLANFDAAQFLESAKRLPRIGLAFSGGGYRAMLSGAGQFSALDSRSSKPSILAGLVQASSYMAGLSGGSWLVGSISLNQFTTIDALQRSSTIWNFEHSIFNPGGWKFWKTANYYAQIVSDVNAKRDHFEVSITDIWGRGLSQQMIDLPDGGASLTWSDISHFDAFQKKTMPFPIVVANAREPGELQITDRTPIVEVTPLEVGSWDPTINSFFKTQYIGSQVDGGRATQCVGGFDNAGFIMGTSSSLFNAVVQRVVDRTGALGKLISSIFQNITVQKVDIASYKPNPFKDTPHTQYDTVKADRLELVDGGEDGENIPLAPLIQPARQLDVIIAFDNSADTGDKWPNGVSLVDTYKRQFSSSASHVAFPQVPSESEFLSRGLTHRPAFFGCYTAKLRDLPGSENGAHPPPLLVYIANTQRSAMSNHDTFKLQYTNAERDETIQNGYDAASLMNGSIDPDWQLCLACAVIQRERERANTPIDAQCQTCFNKYCF